MDNKNEQICKPGSSSLVDGIMALLSRGPVLAPEIDMRVVCNVECKTCRHYQAKLAYAFYSTNHYANKNLPCNGCEAFARWEKS